MSQMIQVYKIKNGVKKLISLQEGIWKTILGGSPLPEGVTYELAPKFKVENIKELIPAKPEVKASVKEVVEPAETFTKEDVAKATSKKVTPKKVIKTKAKNKKSSKKK